MNNRHVSTHRFFRPAIVYPVILIVLIFVDGSLMAAFSGLLSFANWTILPNLTFIGIFYTIHFRSDRHFHFWWWLVLLGLLFDLYYTQSIGSYLTAYLLSAYTVFLLDPHIPYRILSSFWTVATGLLVFYSLIYITGILTGEVNISLVNYLIFTVFPTIFINSLIEMIFYRPVESLTYIINS
ncbi:rod shape-determining protein MreD [Oenococcus sp.]|uniref:rod shape-determining protein MreD n=1 Tax=Oenococcus sp. TaxID=1979414 RepID=UPI0039EC7696